MLLFLGESIVSDFHNDLFQFNFEKERWYTVNLRPSKITRNDILPGQTHLLLYSITVAVSSDAAAAANLAEEEEKVRRHKAAVKIQSRCVAKAVSEGSSHVAVGIVAMLCGKQSRCTDWEAKCLSCSTLQQRTDSIFPFSMLRSQEDASQPVSVLSSTIFGCLEASWRLWIRRSHWMISGD